MSTCYPPWSPNGDTNIECPYGREVPYFTFTEPKSIDVLDVIFMTYSAIPLIITGIVLLVFIYKRNSFYLSVFLLCTISPLIPALLKFGFKQPRPIGSCLFSCGMPSGHSTFALTLYIFLSIAIIKKPGAILSIEHRSDQFYPDVESQELLETEDQGNQVLVDPELRLRQPREHDLNISYQYVEVFWLLTIIFILLLPIPYSRIYLRDHSLSQVLWGSGLGILLAIVFFLLFCGENRWAWLEQSKIGKCIGFQNNFK